LNIVSTTIECFVAIARHHGVDLSIARLGHDYGLDGSEPSNDRILAIAGDHKLQATVLQLDWESLSTLPPASFPIQLRLQDGSSIIALGMMAETGQLRVIDPRVPDKSARLLLGRDELEKNWCGQILLFKRIFRLTDEQQPFGLRWFIPDLWRQRAHLRDVAVTAVMLYGFALAMPIFFQLVIDKVLVHHSYSTLYVLLVGVVIFVVFEAILQFLRQYLLLYATNKIDIRLASRVFAHLVSLPVGFFEQNLAGVVTQHMQQNSRIREFLTGRLFLTLLDAAALVVFIPVLLLYSVKLTMILLVFCILVALIIASLMGPFRRRLTSLYQAEAERQGMLVETIHGMQTIKALALEPRQRNKWEERVANSTLMRFRVGKISAIAQASTGSMDKLMLIAIIGVGATDVFAGTLTVGALVAFQMLSNRVSGPLLQIVGLINEYQETALSVRMLGEIMNRAPEVSIRGLTHTLQGDISFEDVSFSYQPEVRVLEHITFRIPRGRMIGVVGRSGSGKTTLARMIQGLYQAQEGTIRFDGVNARDIDIANLRRSIGVVPQETFLFHGTVRENIAVSRPGATLEEVVRAARMAGADEFIDRLQQGYDTLLKENATNLSGGQRQRLAIARALLNEPRILIFDEATSALDPESEALILRNLSTIASGRTVFMITHRLTSLAGADALLVFDRGRIIQSGRHAELINLPGLYRELWLEQSRHFQS
jgi:ATP-binding cassette, subfamily B, bacterial HlyB/CyaB